MLSLLVLAAAALAVAAQDPDDPANIAEVDVVVDAEAAPEANTDANAADTDTNANVDTPSPSPSPSPSPDSEPPPSPSPTISVDENLSILPSDATTDPAHDFLSSLATPSPSLLPETSTSTSIDAPNRLSEHEGTSRNGSGGGSASGGGPSVHPGVIIGGVLGGVAIVALLSGLCLWKQRRERRRRSTAHPDAEAYAQAAVARLPRRKRPSVSGDSCRSYTTYDSDAPMVSKPSASASAHAP